MRKRLVGYLCDELLRTWGRGEDESGSTPSGLAGGTPVTCEAASSCNSLDGESAQR
jgi:hypothetical protein